MKGDRHAVHVLHAAKEERGVAKGVTRFAHVLLLLSPSVAVVIAVWCYSGTSCECDVEVAIDVLYEQEMYGLHRRVAPGEVMLGW